MIVISFSVALCLFQTATSFGPQVNYRASKRIAVELVELGASKSTTSSRLLPAIFPGQSLAHNLHEIALGVLIDSNGQNVLSKQRVVRESRRLRAFSDQRTVRKVDKFERIPTWPASNGIRWKAISQFNPDLAAKLEHQYGGADCPNLWLDKATSPQTSPFLMMCHHNHSFRLNDPVRLMEKQIMPEGFPAHGHRGMTTVTICLRGGLVHRDSEGNKQLFGADEPSRSAKKPYKGMHTQWLTFGKGIIHELMWDNSRREGQFGRRDNGNVVHQEIYQIWVDLPSDERLTEPRIELLGDDESPTVVENGCKTTIIAGDYSGSKASVDTVSDLSILTAQIGQRKVWQYAPPTSHSTVIIYVRLGSIKIGQTEVDAHCTAYLSQGGESVSIHAEKGAEILVLSGQPLDQRSVAKGCMVTDSHEDLERAFADYEQGHLGVPWSETCTDDEWREHLKQHNQLQ